MNHSAQSRLSLDDRIRHPHLSAQRRQEDDQLNRIHIIRDQHQPRFLILHQPNDMVKPILDRIRLLADIFLLLSLRDSSRLFQQTFLLLGFRFGLVLGEELEGLRGGVAVEGRVELGDGGRDFEAEIEDLTLALEAYVFGPLYHARQVAAWLDVLSNAEVAGAFFDEGVLRMR